MRTIRAPGELRELPRGGALTIGNFDGVHRGHAQLIARVRALAAASGGPAAVLTFEPHPARLLRPGDAPPPLTWLERKAQLLQELGVDILIAYHTTPELLQMPAADFFERLVVQELQVHAMVEGPNFFFGRDRQGDVALLRRLCQAYGVTLEIVPPLILEGELVSSSRIREAIRAGHVALAARLLTRPYTLRGMVTHGAQRGSTLGFPTANLNAIDTLIPAPGVYAGQAVHDGLDYRAAIHIGPNPTFAEHRLKVEVHLIDFYRSIYGEPLVVRFERRLREIRQFASVDELRRQLQQDIAEARRRGEPVGRGLSGD